MRRPRVDATIGILTYRSKGLLQGCLDSIRRTPWMHHYEVIVVDNNSQDGSAEMVERRYPDVRLIRNRNNRGVARGRNQILNKASGDYVILLDVDTLVQPGSLDTLMETMNRHPEAAVGGPKLVYRDGRLQHSCRPFPSPWNILLEGTFLRDWMPSSRFVKEYTMEEWDHGEMKEVDWMYGATLIIRRAALEKIGPFDEKFFYLYEDVDLCFRARRKGYKVLYIPEAVVTHFLERERKGIFHAGIGIHVRSIVRYLLKDYYGLVFSKEQ